MLKAIITYLNLKLDLLNYFDLTRCLSELKIDNEGKTAPKEYISNGNWDNIDFDNKDGVSYWRLRDEITTSPIESVYKAGKRVEVTIPLKLVFSVPRRKLTEDDAYSFDRIRQTITKQFNIDDGDIKNTLGCEKVEISSPTANGDAKEVWDEETENTGTHEPNYDVVFGSVDVDVKLIYKGTCLPTECDDVDSDILHSFNFCSAAIRGRLTPGQLTCLEDALCGVCADATVENSDASYSTTVASGGTLVVPDTTINVNGSLLVNQPSTITKNVIVKYVNGTPVGSIVGGEVEVPNPASSGTVSIGVFSDAGHTNPITTQDWEGTVYIKATPTNITPTNYSFAFKRNGVVLLLVEQASNEYTWTVNVTGAIKIEVVATDVTDLSAFADMNFTVNDHAIVSDVSNIARYSFENDADLVFNGSTISQVNDLTGNGLHLVNASAGQQPSIDPVLTSTGLQFADFTGKQLANTFLTPVDYTDFTLILVYGTNLYGLSNKIGEIYKTGEVSTNGLHSIAINATRFDKKSSNGLYKSGLDLSVTIYRYQENGGSNIIEIDTFILGRQDTYYYTGSGNGTLTYENVNMGLLATELREAEHHYIGRRLSDAETESYGNYLRAKWIGIES